MTTDYFLNGIGFKSTPGDLTCHNSFKYDIGEVYEHTGTLELYYSGFHLCKQLQQTFAINDPHSTECYRYFVVSYDDRPSRCYEADDKDSLDPMVVTMTIRLDEEIKVEDHLEMSDTVKRYPNEHMMLYLIRHGGSLYAKQVVKQLLDYGADIHANNGFAMKYASCWGLTDIVQFLLDHGADVHVDNDSALYYASKIGRTEVVRLLLNAGADVHADNDDALKWASVNGHIEVVRLLLDKGADVHSKNDRALRSASFAGQTEVVKLLLARGADVHANDDQALLAASKWGHTEIVRLLLDKGADVHACYDLALLAASHNDHIEVVNILLNAGADMKPINE